MGTEFQERPVILFDGDCGRCLRSVGFVLRCEVRPTFRFASLDSEAARRLLLEAGAPEAVPDSLVLIDGDGLHYRSDAVLRIAARLRRPWRWAGVFGLVPRGLRDAVYRIVARNRRRGTGERSCCPTPTPGLLERRLDAGELAARDPAGSSLRGAGDA